MRELEPELRSHLQLTRIRICRRGDDRENFISAAPHYFQHRDSDDSEHEMLELYEAYASCSWGMKRSRGETTVTVPHCIKFIIDRRLPCIRTGVR